MTYNAKATIRDCITALSVDAHPFEVIVIDNRSLDGTQALLNRLDSLGDRFRVTLNPQNIGFGKACNQGAALSRGQYLLFLNPDAVAEAPAIEGMAAYLDHHPDIAVLGPKVRVPDGSLQLSCGRRPTLQYRLFEALRLSQLAPKLFGRYRYARLDHSTPRDVDWVSGCCMMVRTEVFKHLGGFDETFFLFEEDVDLCLRIVEAGHRVVYWPRVVIYHSRGQSSKSVRAFSALASYRSKLVFARKYGHPVEYVILRCVFPVISVAKSVAASLLALVTRDRAYLTTARAHVRVATALLLGHSLKPRLTLDTARSKSVDSE